MKKIIAMFTSAIAVFGFASSAVAQGTETQPLHSFISSKGYRLYKTGSKSPADLSDGPWKDEGVKAHVMPKQSSGSKPVYQLAKTDAYGVRFAYTSDAAEANKYQGGPAGAFGIGQWKNQGVYFYVASVQTPGTVPLYKLYAPAQTSGKSGDAFSGMSAGTDAVFLTTKLAEKVNATNNGWVSQGIIGYVWKEPFPPASVDLSIQSAVADENSVKVIYANGGKQAASNPGLKIALTVFDKAGKQITTISKPAGGVSPNSKREIVIPTGNVTLRNNRFQVEVDADNVIAESNETNNTSARLDGPKGIKIKPLPEGYIPPPTIAIKDIKNAPNGRTTYSLTVTNRENFKPDAFQSLENILPPNPCGGGGTNARMIARIFIVKDASVKPLGCKPLNSQADLAVLDITTSDKLGDTDRFKIFIEDRASGEKFASGEFAVGWFAVDKVLVPAGCKYFLGRVGSYLCTSDQGMKTCEGLKTQGKPIQCKRAGK